MRVVCLICLFFLQPSLGRRIASGARQATYAIATDHSEIGGNLTAIGEFEEQLKVHLGLRSTWTLNYYSVPCVLKDDFSQLKPFAPGLMREWGKTSGDLLKLGLEQASKYNCRLCNIEVSGSIQPVAFANSKPWRQISVSCAATVTDLQESCFGENGHIGSFNGPHASPRKICAPCPDACEAGCDSPGRTDTGYWSSTWFKCKTKTMHTIGQNAVFPAGGKEFTTSDKYQCEQTTLKNLKRNLKDADIQGFGEADTAMVPSFTKRSGFEKADGGEYKLWCKYKADIEADNPDSRKSPSVAPGSRWSLDPGLSECRSAVGSAVASSDDSFLSRVSAAAGPRMAENANKYNCEICNMKLGGSMQAIVSSPLSEVFNLVKVVEDEKEIASDETLWIQPSCATNHLGISACNTRIGRVGWETPTSCRPCPRECMTCEAIKGTFTSKANVNSFKCVLLPDLPFPNPSMVAMTEDVSPSLEGEENHLYHAPDGYDCDKPKRRNCGMNTHGWCEPWMYKTNCRFPTEYSSMQPKVE